ncbi:MAG: hypothetical protein WBW01_09585 [Terriglobales bacterium]
MDNALGNGKRKRSKALDLLFLIGAGVVVAVVGTAAFWIADTHHATVGMLAACIAIGFFTIIGKTYGVRKLRSLPFAAFSMVWLLIHVCIFLLVMGYLGFLYYLPFLVAELFVGFMAAIWLFGPPVNGPT